MDSLWLKTTLRVKKVTQRSLGEAIGLSQDKINKALAHVRQFSTIEAIKIADYLEKFQVDRTEALNALLGKDAAFLQKVGEQKPSGFQALNSSAAKPIPIIGKVGALGALYNAEANNSTEYAAPVSSSAASLVAVRVEGEVLAPSYRNGDLLYYDDHGKIDNGAFNKEAIVELSDGRKFLCIVKRSTMEGRFNLETFHSPAMEFVSLTSASRILWAQKA